MKKKLSISIVFIFAFLLIINNAYAEINFSYEKVRVGDDSRYDKPLIYVDNNYPEYRLLIPPATYEINGKTYIWPQRQEYSHPLEYSEHIYNAFKGERKAAGDYTYPIFYKDVIWTGEYYMVRKTNDDGSMSKYSPYLSNPIQFYDKDFNFVREQTFSGYTLAMEFYKGKYYCMIYTKGYDFKEPAHYEVLESSDTVNWTRIDDDQEFPKIPCTLGDVTCKYMIHDADTKIAIGYDDFHNIIYENGGIGQLGHRFGEFTCCTKNNKLYFSRDTVYQVEVGNPDNIGILNMYSDFTAGFKYIYEYEDDLIIDTYSNYRIRIPKKQLYDELYKVKDAPYICYDEQILAFEQPPVIQDDYTLVPIRFLFEQMGADVTWNQDTQTATITQDNKAITFGIDDTDASVNGSTVSMDVPARLINDKTMVPVRFLSEKLGYTVNWDGDNRIITIE